MSQKRKRARDECSICKANGSNAVGHLAQWCSYKDGPFEGNFKGAIKAKKEAEKEAKKAKGLGGVAAQSTMSAKLASLERKVHLESENKCVALSSVVQSIDHVREDSASKDELKELEMETRIKFEAQEKVIQEMKQIITQLQAQVAELKQPKQPRPRQNQGQWKQNNWRSSSYQNWY